MSPVDTAEEINYRTTSLVVLESRTARAARYSETLSLVGQTECLMLVGVMSVLVSNVQRTEVVPRK